MTYQKPVHVKVIIRQLMFICSYKSYYGGAYVSFSLTYCLKWGEMLICCQCPDDPLC